LFSLSLWGYLDSGYALKSTGRHGPFENQWNNGTMGKICNSPRKEWINPTFHYSSIPM
jgi:hypothetical protein